MPGEEKYQESELLLRVAQGDTDAFKVLFRQYWDQIYSTAFFFTKSTEASEDLAQDVFARIWLKRDHLRSVTNFESYLYIFAKNLIFDRLRKKEFSGSGDEQLRQYFSDEDSNPAVRLELKEFDSLIHQAIDSLTPQQRIAFRLSRFEGLSHEEIADKMGLSKRTVKNHMVNAIAFLKSYLQSHSGQLVILGLMIFI